MWLNPGQWHVGETEFAHNKKVEEKKRENPK